MPISAPLSHGVFWGARLLAVARGGLRNFKEAPSSKCQVKFQIPRAMIQVEKELQVPRAWFRVEDQPRAVLNPELGIRTWNGEAQPLAMTIYGCFVRYYSASERLGAPERRRVKPGVRRRKFDSMLVAVTGLEPVTPRI
jgi:hypothetical protein